MQKSPCPLEGRCQPWWEFLCPQLLKAKSPQLTPSSSLPTTELTVSRTAGPLTHLHDSKARATGPVLSARLALLAGAVLPFLAGTNSV